MIGASKYWPPPQDRGCQLVVGSGIDIVPGEREGGKEGGREGGGGREREREVQEATEKGREGGYLSSGV